LSVKLFFVTTCCVAEPTWGAKNNNTKNVVKDEHPEAEASQSEVKMKAVPAKIADVPDPVRIRSPKPRVKRYESPAKLDEFKGI
jgi:hypothetical protein